MTEQNESASVTGVIVKWGPPPAASTATLHRSTRLRASLAALSQLGTGLLTLPDSLVRIAHLAVQAIPAAEAAGLILLEQGHADAIVSTAEFVREMDDIQFAIRQGPCITAADQRRTQRTGALGGAHEWPQFGRRVAGVGVGVLALPLLTSGDAIGALGLYSHARDAFDADDAAAAEQFAVPAAVSVQNVLALAQSQRLAEQLQSALRSRPVIDQAIGVTMTRTGATATEAFDQIRQTSRSQRLKTAVIAQRIIDDAVHRADRRTEENKPAG